MRKLGVIIVVIAASAGIASAQFSHLPLDYNILGGGARAHGMGGAFIGVADDATATSWNPAGIAQLDKFEASAVANFSLKKYTFITDINAPSIPYTESDEYTTNSNHIAPNFFSLAAPLKLGDRNLVLAIAYQRMIDFGYDNEEDSTTYSWDYTVRGGIDAISPAIAIQLTPKFMIGVAGNIIVNGVNHKSEFVDKTTNITTNVERDYKSSGFNMNGGILIQASPKFNIGASIRLPFTITDEYTYTWEQTGATSFDTTYPDQETTYPMMFGLGVAFKPTDNLTLAADYERRNYESSEFTYGEPRTTEEMGWNNVNQFRVGMEYVAVSPAAVFPIRLGFRTAPRLAYEKYEYNGTTTDSTNITGLVFTGGFGMKFGSVWFDLAYELGMSDVWSYTGDYPNGDFEEYKMKEMSNNIIASCIFHF
jgi:long-subunit fatty acid transport protein